MFAVGDTGATRTLLTEEAARPYQLVELDPQEERVVVYAGGEEGKITGKVKLGELDALVVPGIKENLVSIFDLTSRGSTMKLSNSGGVISNPVNEKEINLMKKEGTWKLNLDDVATYDHEGYVGAYLAAMPRSKAERYIDLHERLGHQSWKVIAEVLDDCTGGERYWRKVYMCCMHVVETKISVCIFQFGESRWFSRRN